MLWSLAFSVLIRLAFTAELSPENRLFQDLMLNYNKNIRPIKDPNQLMIVNVSFILKMIDELNERNQVLSTFGWIDMSWEDELLTWNPADYNNTRRLVVSAEEIWLPELVLYNSVNQENDLTLDAKFRVSINHDGRVLFAPGYKWNTACQTKLEVFPYDKQVCYIMFLNWIYTAESIIFQDGGVSLTSYENNSAWTLNNISSGNAIDSDDGLRVPFVYMVLELQRNPTYYMVNVVIPCCMISVLSSLVFLLPADSGEKISLAITVSLAYTVLLLMISDITPRNGDSLPYLTMFILESMGQTVVSLIVAVLILNVYYHHANSPVPQAIRRLAFGVMATLLGMRGQMKHIWPGNKLKPAEHNDESDTTVTDLMEAASIYKCSLPDDVLTYVRLLISNVDDQEKEEKFKAEWVALGRIIDRMCFLISVILSLIEICVLMSRIMQ